MQISPCLKGRPSYGPNFRRRPLALYRSTEMDDEKLMILVGQLCSAFDECHKTPPSERGQASFALAKASKQRKPTANPNSDRLLKHTITTIKIAQIGPNLG